MISDSVDDIRALKEVFDGYIHSIVKYGFGKRNILVVLNNVSVKYLAEIKPFLRKLQKTKNVFVIGKNDPVLHSIGIDFLNIKLTSVVIYGADIFADYEVDQAKVKRQIRYEASRLLLSLRNEYLAQRWSWKMRSLLCSTVPRILPLVVAHLYLMGGKIPNAIPDTLNKYAQQNEDAAVLLRIPRKPSAKQMDALFQDVMALLENLGKRVA